MSRHSPELIRELEERARRLRVEVVKMIAKAQSGHPGGSLSAADIVAALYFHQLRINPKEPHWPDRDRFVLSKGHSCPVLYAVLAELGYFPKEELGRLRQLGGILQGHPDMNKTPGLDMTSGSLGQGLSVGIGMALGARFKRKDFHVYVLMGCGEMNEGQVWEAAMAASHYRIDNLTGIVDYNRVQLDGPLSKIMEVDPIVDKWRAFRWKVLEIDGHKMAEILEALDEAIATKGGPTVIIAHTVKGKGVSFMEGSADWHGKAPNKEQLAQALRELGEVVE